MMKVKTEISEWKDNHQEHKFFFSFIKKEICDEKDKWSKIKVCKDDYYAERVKIYLPEYIWFLKYWLQKRKFQFLAKNILHNFKANQIRQKKSKFFLV